MIEPDGVHQAFDYAVQVCIVEDDEWRLPAKLQRQPLATAGGFAADDPSDLGRARERNLVHAVVFDDQLAGSTIARHHVDYTGWQAHPLADVGKGKRGQRREFRGLEHDGVSGRQCWSDLPRQHEQWKIPRNDLSHDADGREASEHLLP